MTKKIILGTAQFGQDYGISNNSGQPKVSEVFKILTCAMENDIEILDTADAYGEAAKIIGSFLKLHPKAFVINTKFEHTSEPLRNKLDESLNTLNIKNINTYFFHNFNDFVNYPSVLEELVDIKGIGLINKIGLSVYDNFELDQAVNCEDIDVIQVPFNLLDNYSQKGKLLEKARLKGKEIQVRSIFLQGLFFIPLEELPLKIYPLRKYLEVLQRISAARHISLEKLALQYAINQPFVDYIVMGVDTLEQLEKNLNIAACRIVNDYIEEIDTIHVSEYELLFPRNW